jgi:acyl dehydratase
VTTAVIQKAINDEQIERVQEQVGVTRKRSFEEWEFADARVLRSQIRGWSVALGDMRPLFVDPEYAERSPWGTLIAPPGVVACYEQIDPEIDCLPGSYSVLASAKVEWERPIRLGDLTMADSTLTAVNESAEPAGRVVSIQIATSVRDQQGQSFGRAVLDWRCHERGSATQLALFGNRQEPHMWSREDIDALGAEYKTEKQRGAEPLYWEDVRAGDKLDHVLKGPTTRTKYMGRLAGNWYWGHLQGWEASEQRPELFFRNENNAPEPVTSTDWVHHRAQRWGGLPGALEVNSDRIHYCVQTLMNWMGDAGFPLRLDLKFPVQNMVGDITRTYGRVRGKRREGDRNIVELDLWQENQLDERITNGTAEVLLPSRD